MKEKEYYSMRRTSPLGDALFVSDEERLVGLWVGKQRFISKSLPPVLTQREDVPILQESARWLEDYFAGKQPALSRLHLFPLGSDFRQVVWQILLEIPYGELATYGEVAKEVASRMGKEKMSARAVGGAIGHNPISIIIPCHRVVGTNGSLTGYGGGINMKVKLLTHEGVDMSKLYVPTKGTAL